MAACLYEYLTSKIYDANSLCCFIFNSLKALTLEIVLSKSESPYYNKTKTLKLGNLKLVR